MTEEQTKTEPVVDTNQVLLDKIAELESKINKTETIDINSVVENKFDELLKNFDEKQIIEEAEKVKSSVESKKVKDDLKASFTGLLNEQKEAFDARYLELEAKNKELSKQLSSFKTKSLAQETSKNNPFTKPVEPEKDMNTLFSEALDGTNWF